MWYKILLSLLMFISILHGQTAKTVVHAEIKKVVAINDEANVTLYATGRNGMLENFEMKVDGGISYFPFWMNISKPAFAPRILYNDINHDGKKELIIVLTKGEGTGFLDSEVHVFHKIQTNIGENFKEILVDNPMAIILKSVKTKLTQHEAVVTIGNKKSVINLDSFHIPPDHLFTDVYFGNIIDFDVVDNQLMASIDGQITPAMFIGPVVITYEFKEKMYQAKKIEFKSSLIE